MSKKPKARIKNSESLAGIEELLKQKNFISQILLDNLPQKICFKDRDSVYVFCNDSYAADLGIKRKEIAGKTDFEFYPKDLAEKYRQDDKEVMDFGENKSLVERYVQDGQEFTVSTLKAPMRDEKGKVFGVLVVFSDVTEFKKTENKALRKNKVLECINTVFQAAYSSESEEDLAKKCLSLAEELTGSQFGFLGEINAVGRYDTIAISDPGWKQCRLEHSEATVLINDMEIRGLWGRVLKEGKSFYTNDPAGHPDSTGLPEGHPPLTSFLGVPLMQEGRVTGMVSLGNKAGGYNELDKEDMEDLAGAIGQAIYSKRNQQALARQSQEIMELSTPVIQVWEGVVVAPLIGVLDSQRTMHFMERFLDALVNTSSSLALLDITGVPAVDTQTAQHLVEAITAAKLLGTRVVLTGVRPAIAQTMVHLGIDLADVDTKSSLSAGLRLCFEILGMQVSKKV